MASVKSSTTIQEFQDFVREVYGVSNDRYFDTNSMLTNIQRFTMRGLKGIRKGDKARIVLNLSIVQSWFASLMNRLHISIEDEVWKRFPFACSYCVLCPCVCKAEKIKTRRKVGPNKRKQASNLTDFQAMFQAIYPSATRSIEHAGIHLAEEMGELSEAVLQYQGLRNEKDFARIALESADFFSCIMGVFNSLGVSVSKELSTLFVHNCSACKKAPCECSFTFIANFSS